MFEDHKRGRAIWFQCMDMGLGTVKVDSVEQPTVALYSYFPFNFVVGDSSSPVASELLAAVPAMTVVLTPDDGWTKLLTQEWAERIVVMDRTRFDADSLDLDHVRALKARLPPEFEMHPLSIQDIESIDKRHVGQIQTIWGSVDQFEEKNIGFSIKHREKAVTMAYPAFPYINEFEVQVATLESPEYRRKGLATVVSAVLIEYALENNLVPHWDAANEESVGLALKLGYTNPDAYEVYVRRG
ncbi:MAG: GNAT family N-acetyltransferase [Candidatus Thorarchaeota archaeon]